MPLVARFPFARAGLMLTGLALGSTVVTNAAPWKTTVTGTVTHDANATRSLRDQKHDTVFTGGVELSQLRILNRDWQGNLTVLAQGTHWREYDGLNLAETGLRAGLRRKFGLGPYAPRIDLSVQGSRVFAATRGWTGNRFAATAAWSRRFSPVLLTEFAAEIDRFDARRTTYSGTGYTLRAKLDWDPNPDWRISGGLRWRDGDRTAWCRESWPEITGGPHWKDGIFGGDWFPYHDDATTTGANVAVSRVLGTNTSITLSYDFSRSRASRSNIYDISLLSLSLVHVF